MNISIPDSLRPWVEEQARLGRKTPDEFVAAVLYDAQARGDESGWEAVLREAMSDGDPASVSDEDLARRKKEIEAKLLEALASGPSVEVTPEFWEGIRQEVRDRQARRRGQ
jgi:Arc/MetJ-type ribon-helix-helix transcriptional regulator